MRRLTRLLMFVLVSAAGVVGLVVLPGAAAEVTTSVTVVASADAYVRSAEAATNFGGESELRIDRAPNDNASAQTLRTYIRFEIPDLPAPVSRAVLRLYAREAGAALVGLRASEDGRRVYEKFGFAENPHYMQVKL